jgi:hypothetical protein
MKHWLRERALHPGYTARLTGIGGFAVDDESIAAWLPYRLPDAQVIPRLDLHGGDQSFLRRATPRIAAWAVDVPASKVFMPEDVPDHDIWTRSPVLAASSPIPR